MKEFIGEKGGEFLHEGCAGGEHSGIPGVVYVSIIGRGIVGIIVIVGWV